MTPYLMKRGDMELCVFPATEPVEPEAETQTVDRMEKIKDAITKVSPEDYSKQAHNRPSLPKVAAVSEITGFSVTRAEILEAMESIQ